MTFFGNNEPFGMPKGTVRATMALGVILVWLIMVVGAFFTQDASTELFTNPPALIPLIAGWYFGTRGKENNGDTNAEV